MLEASLNADNVFDIPQALINSNAETRDKLFLAAMIMPTINPKLAKDGSMYKFVNEMFSYGNTQLFSNQQIRQHLQDALDDKKRVQDLINKHTANRKVESAKDPIKARLAEKQHDIDMKIKANDRIDQAEHTYRDWERTIKSDNSSPSVMQSKNDVAHSKITKENKDLS